MDPLVGGSGACPVARREEMPGGDFFRGGRTQLAESLGREIGSLPGVRRRVVVDVVDRRAVTEKDGTLGDVAIGGRGTQAGRDSGDLGEGWWTSRAGRGFEKPLTDRAREVATAYHSTTTVGLECRIDRWHLFLDSPASLPRFPGEARRIAPAALWPLAGCQVRTWPKREQERFWRLV